MSVREADPWTDEECQAMPRKETALCDAASDEGDPVGGFWVC